MARIRTIKPEFWSDEKLSPLAPIDRLTFLGLISMADDYGRVHDARRLSSGLIIFRSIAKASNASGFLAAALVLRNIS